MCVCGGGTGCFRTRCRVNYQADSVVVKQTDRRARHQLLERLLGKIKASGTNECTAFTPLLYNLYPVNPSITPPLLTRCRGPCAVQRTVGAAVYPNGMQEILLLLAASVACFCCVCGAFLFFSFFFAYF